MPHSDFVHLRVHSAYSLSQGAIRVAEIAALAQAASMPAVAIADSGNLFGALEFSQYCTAKGVQPIIGCQVSLGGRVDRGVPVTEPVVLLAQDAAGLANLQHLSSIGFLESDPADPCITLDTLCAHAEGLMLLTGGTRGPLARLLGDGQQQEARRLLATLAQAFPGRVAVEIQRHGLPIERAIEPGMIGLADELGLPLVATNECFFATPVMHEAHDALLCIAQGRTMAERERWRVTPEQWFKPPAMMRALFADLPEACDNTLAIARRCAVMAETRKPAAADVPEGAGRAERGRDAARDGPGRAGAAAAGDAGGGRRGPAYGARLEFELGVIAAMGFPGYFMIVADFIQWAKATGIPVGPGRGSGAGSLVGVGADASPTSTRSRSTCCSSAS